MKTIATSATTLIVFVLVALAASIPVADWAHAVSPSPYHADGLAVTETIATGQASAGRWIYVSGTRSTLNLKVTSVAGPRIDQVSVWEHRNQRWIETVPAGDPATTITRIALSGWYYIYVHRSDTAPATDYRLDANVNDPQQVLEAGTTFATAYDLGVVGPGGASFYGRVNASDGTDVVKISLPFSRQRLDVYAFDTFRGGAMVDLFDGSGSLINGRDTMGDESLLYGASLPGGIYYVKIAAGVNMPGTGYHLFLRATDETPGAPSASGGNTGGRLGDNNGVQYLAERLSADSAGGFSVQQTIGFNDRDDWFRIDAAPSCCYLLRVQGLAVKSIFEPTMVEFWGPRGRYLPLTVALDGSLFFIVRMEAGTNWIHINVPSGVRQQTYQLSLSYRPEK